MILSDRDLIREIHNAHIAITPLRPSAIQPSSVDLLLSPFFRVFNNAKYTHIDPSNPPDDLTILVEKSENDPFILHPGEFVLGSTVERVGLGSSYAARLEGKSSVGRCGLQVHSTAGVIDPGFNGEITLELSNIANFPLLLRPFTNVAQLTVFMMLNPASKPYGHPDLGSRYQGQAGPTAPRRAQIPLGDQCVSIGPWKAAGCRLMACRQCIGDSL
jgi:dCTP deaminase